jgi:RNA polymerase sigma-70 factor (sigma-E family)
VSTASASRDTFDASDSSLSLDGGTRSSSVPDDPDITVVVTAGTRDEEFTAFVRSASPGLGRVAWLLCGDAHQAEELVQQALVRTYVAWPKARARDPYAYARRVLANQRVDTWRRRRREVLMDPSAVPDRGQSTERSEDRDRLVRALALLTARQRRVVVLRHLLDLSEREVADDLGIGVGTVKSTASRALARLRTELADQADGATSPAGRKGH